MKPFAIIALTLAVTVLTAAAAPRIALIRVKDIYTALPSTLALQGEIKAERNEIMKDQRPDELRKIITELQELQARLSDKNSPPSETVGRLLCEQGKRVAVLAVNKTDGDNVQRAKLACTEYRRVLNFLQPATPGWKTRCTTCSALIPETLAALWQTVEKFAASTRESGALSARRKHQSTEWMRAMIEEELHHRFFRNERVKQLLPEIQRQVENQTLPAATAVRRIMENL